MKKFYLILFALIILLVSSVALLADAINLRVGGTGYAWRDSGRVFVVENVVDFSAIEAGTNQVVELIQITAPSVVHAVVWSVEEPANAGVTFEIGDDGDTDRFIAATTATNVAMGASAHDAVHFYSANNSIDVRTPAAIPTEGVIRVKALVSYFGD